MNAFAPSSSSSETSRYFGAAFVATGMKKGVSYSPVLVLRIPVLALPDFAVIVNGCI